MNARNKEPQGSFSETPLVEVISAVTLATTNMAESTRFYCLLGFELIYGGPEETFTSFRANKAYVNLILKSDETVTMFDLGYASDGWDHLLNMSKSKK